MTGNGIGNIRGSKHCEKLVKNFDEQLVIEFMHTLCTSHCVLVTQVTVKSQINALIWGEKSCWNALFQDAIENTMLSQLLFADNDYHFRTFNLLSVLVCSLIWLPERLCIWVPHLTLLFLYLQVSIRERWLFSVEAFVTVCACLLIAKVWCFTNDCGSCLTHLKSFHSPIGVFHT